MGRNVYLHVGLPKTGSSLLQTRVFPGMAGVTLVTWPYLHANHAWNRLQFSDESYFDPEEIRQDVARMGDGTLLVSFEDLAGQLFALHGVNRTPVARRLARALPEAEVIVFLRGQGDLLRSAYAEHVRKLGVERPEDWIRFPGPSLEWAEYRAMVAELGPEGAYRTPPGGRMYHDPSSRTFPVEALRYGALVALYRDLFPRVHVFLYEDLRDEPVATLDRLAEVLGTTLPGRTPPPRANAGLGARPVRWLRHANKLAWIWAPARELARAGVERLPRGGPFRLPPDLATRIEAYYGPDNRALAAREPDLGLQRHGDAYFLGGPEGP